MRDQPKAAVIASLNRLFEESGERNSDGSVNIRTTLLLAVAGWYDWPSVKRELEKLSDLGYVTIEEDPENSNSLHCGIIRSFIPEATE